MNPDDDSDDPDNPVHPAENPEVLKTVKPGDYVIWNCHGSIFPALVKQNQRGSATFQVVNMLVREGGKTWQHNRDEARNIKMAHYSQVVKKPEHPRCINQRCDYWRFPEMAAYQWESGDL